MRFDNTDASVLVVGPLFLDVVMGPLDVLPQPGQEKWVKGCAFVAGGSANQAIALAKLGLEAKLCSFIGQDAPGVLLRDLLNQAGVNQDVLVETKTQSVTTALSVGNDRAMVTCGTDDAPPLTFDHQPAALMGDLRAIGANQEVIKAWKQTPNAPLIIGDVGWDESGKWDPADLDILNLVDYFVPNQEEALCYTRQATVAKAAQELQKLVPAVVITRGPQGVYAYDGTQVVDLPEIPITPLDPTGAGDTFGAMLTWALLQGLPLHEAVSGAALAATYSIQSLGGSASAPTLAQLRDWIPGSPIPESYALDYLH